MTTSFNSIFGVGTVVPRLIGGSSVIQRGEVADLARVMMGSRLVHQVLQERFEKLSRKLELMAGQETQQ